MKLIPLNHGKFSMIDDEDESLVAAYKWQYVTRQKNEYATANHWQKGKNHSVLMHRLIMGAQKGETIDHKNGDGLDNQKNNLRKVSTSQNIQNSRLKTGKYKGVSFSKRRNSYESYISLSDKKVALGSFLSDVAAACAYDFAAIELFGEFARLNFPDGQPMTVQEVETKRGRQGKTSKYHGVHFSKIGRNWKAQIMSNYKQIHIGTFGSENEAAQAYNEAAIQIHGDKAKLNLV